MILLQFEEKREADFLEVPGGRVNTSGVSIDARNRLYRFIPCQEKIQNKKYYFAMEKIDFEKYFRNRKFHF